MAKCECIIGLLCNYERNRLITLEELKEHIAYNIEFNSSLDEDPILRNAKHLRAKEWTLKDYADRRKNTDLTRFNNCPCCGATIDWKEIRGMKCE